MILSYSEIVIVLEHIHTRAYTHVHMRAFSLSLSHTHTHTHTLGGTKVKEQHTRRLNLLCNIFYLPDRIIALLKTPKHLKIKTGKF